MRRLATRRFDFADSRVARRFVLASHAGTLALVAFLLVSVVFVTLAFGEKLPALTTKPVASHATPDAAAPSGTASALDAPQGDAVRLASR